MKQDHQRLRELLTETVTLLCKNGLQFQESVRVEGLLGITVDNKDVFIVHIDEKITELRHCDDSSEPNSASLALKILAGQAAAHASRAGSILSNASLGSLNDSHCVSPSCQVQSLGRIAVDEVTVEELASHVKLERTDIEDNDSVVHSADDTNEDKNSSDSFCGVTRATEYPRLSEILFPSGSRKRKLDEAACSSSDPLGIVVKAQHDGILSEHCSTGQQVLHGDLLHSSSVPDVDVQLTSYSSWNSNNFSDIGCPSNYLFNRNAREALLKHIVDPLVCQAGRCVTSFRVAWRRSTSEELDNAWLDIQRQRLACDAVIRQQADVDFFFSSVTGLYNKACSRTLAKALGIIPAVSYYVVGSGLDDNLWKQLRSEFAGVELKPITRGHTSSSSTDAASVAAAPLFIALKDQNSRYVKCQLERSCAALAVSTDDVKSADVDLQSSNIAKLITVNSELQTTLTDAYTAVMAEASNGFFLQFHC